MMRQIGAALNGSSPSPDRQPVRRHSQLAGRCEGVFWHRTDRQKVRRIALAARRYELAGRAAGRRNGPLGHVALEVLDLLANLVRFKTGRLEPSVAFIMERLRRSKSAVYDALNALKAHGFLDWLRRYEPTGCEGRGPQVRQVSNAYRLVMPPRALRLLGVAGQDVPLPDDVAQLVEDRRRELENQKASLSLDALAVLELDDRDLGLLLAQLGQRVQERESARQTEIQAKNFS